MVQVNADNGTTWFTDVPETAFYAPYVGWAASKKYVDGTSSTTFAPEASITFEQMGTILANCICNTGVVVVATLPPTTYKDAASIAGWAKGSMELMAKYSLLPTDAAGNVNPQKAVTCAEATVALVRLAKATGLGTEPPAAGEQTSTVDIFAEAAARAQSVHDELWASGRIKDGMSEKEKAIEYSKWMSINCSYASNDTVVSVYGQKSWVVDYTLCL